jgi:hypothetical protein
MTEIIVNVHAVHVRVAIVFGLQKQLGDLDRGLGLLELEPTLLVEKHAFKVAGIADGNAGQSDCEQASTSTCGRNALARAVASSFRFRALCLGLATSLSQLATQSFHQQ